MSLRTKNSPVMVVAVDGLADCDVLIRWLARLKNKRRTWCGGKTPVKLRRDSGAAAR
jgi:hypothetical protein